MSIFDGKVALVTGGGTGIGRATALQLAAEGAAVAINYSHSNQEAEDTAAQINSMGTSSIVIQTDVSQESQVRSMIATVVEKLGGIDLLVNNAGCTRAVLPTDLKGVIEEDFDQIFAVNVKGVFFCSRTAIPEMERRGHGHIINVASIAGITGLGSSLVYAASKAAVINLTRGMAHGQAPKVQINSVSPGMVDTRWHATMGDAMMKKNVEATPMGRAALADDVATAIIGLFRSTYITGTNLVVDGGRTI